MNGRIVLAAFAVMAAAALTTTALAASTAKNPKTMVLQKADFPAGARVINKDAGAASAAGAGYYIAYRYKSGSKTRELGSFASVWNSLSLARLGFREGKTDVLGTKLALPKYGDEQVAGWLGLDGGMLVVRKNTVVWSLKIEYDIDIGLTKAEALAELKRYAPKQMKRVGSG